MRGPLPQRQIAFDETIRLVRVTRVYLTHAHGDHCFGLPGLMCTRSGSFDFETPSPLFLVVGPAGTREYLRCALRFAYAHLSYDFMIHELHPDEASAAMPFGEPWDREQRGLNLVPDAEGLYTIPPLGPDDGFTVQAGPLAHRVPSYGYVLTEQPRLGSLDAARVRPRIEAQREALIARGVANPLSLMSKIKNGETIELPDGTLLRPADCVSAPRPGRKLVILGDTSDSWSLEKAALDCDALVHESTNANVAIPDQPPKETDDEFERVTISHGHSTPQMAGRFAAAVRAKRLLLNHFSPRYIDETVDEAYVPVTQAIVALAQRHFDGVVIASRDHLVVNIPYSD